MVSKTPSPYCRPRSRTDTLSSFSPLIRAINSATTSSLHPERQQQAARLRACFGALGLGVGIGDAARARAKTNPLPLHPQRADQDIEIEASVAIEVAHRARVRTTHQTHKHNKKNQTPHQKTTKKSAPRK